MHPVVAIVGVAGGIAARIGGLHDEIEARTAAIGIEGVLPRQHGLISPQRTGQAAGQAQIAAA